MYSGIQMTCRFSTTLGLIFPLLLQPSLSEYQGSGVTKFGLDRLRQERGSHLSRNVRAIISQNRAPEMSMKSRDNWLTFSCIVNNLDIDSNVFIFCPALSQSSTSGVTGVDDSYPATGYCYENCLPTKTCSSQSTDATLANKNCVPDQQTVNCSQSRRMDGRKVTTITIDKRDRHLVGLWYCTYAGEKSNSVDVSFEPEILDNKNTFPDFLEPNIAKASPVEEHVSPETISRSSDSDMDFAAPPTYSGESNIAESKFAFIAPLANQPWNFVLLGVFALSMTINLVFCIRQCMVSIFIERRNKTNRSESALGCMLCLPTKSTKENSILWDNELFSGRDVDNYPNLRPVHDFSSHVHTLRSLKPGFILESEVPYNFNDNKFIFSNGTFKSIGTTDRVRLAGGSAMYPGQHDWSSMRSNKPQNISGTMQTSWRPQLQESFIPAPSQYLSERTLSAHCSQMIALPKNVNETSHIPETPQPVFPHATKPPSVNTVYDDLASSSSVQMSSRVLRNNFLASGYAPLNSCNSFLPRMAENLLSEDAVSAFKSDYTSSLIKPNNKRFSSTTTNDTYALHGDQQV